MFLGHLCYALGILAALYVGGVMMVLHPVEQLYHAFMSGSLTVHIVLLDALRIFFSATVAGLVWCIGYMGYNFFKGKEDPDWDEINARVGCQEDKQ